MPLKSNLKKLPSKKTVSQTAEKIKTETVKKTESKSLAKKDQNANNIIARRQINTSEKGNYSNSNRTKGKTSVQKDKVNKKTFKKSAKEQGLYHSNPNANAYSTMHKSMYNGSINTGNERRRAFANRELREVQQEAFANTVGGRFLANTAESLIDNSVIAAPYTFATGKKPTQTDFFRGQPESELTDEQRQRAAEREERMHTGIAAGAGRMAGMAINYGMARSAINPALNRATDAVMNGTKVGQAIKGSSILGKIGQSVGRSTAQDIGRGLVKESISDATLGFGQNALINYGEGLRGEDFWRQQAKDTAFDFLVGGAMEGVGIGRQIRQAGKQADAVGNIKLSDILANSNSRDEYLDALGQMSKPLKEQGLNVDAGRRLREASGLKGSELTKEYRKVLNMTDDEFLRYAGRTSAEETAEETVENVAKKKNRKQGKTATVQGVETKAEYENRKAVEERIRQENPDTYHTARRRLKKAPSDTTINVGESVQAKVTPEAKAKIDATAETKRVTKNNSKPTREDFETRRNTAESEEDLKKLYKDLGKTVSESEDATKSPVWDIYEEVGYKLAELNYDKKLANRLKRTTSEKGLKKLAKELEDELNTTAGNRESIKETHQAALDKLNKLRGDNASKPISVKAEEPSALAKATTENTNVKAEESIVKETAEPKVKKPKTEEPNIEEPKIEEPKAETKSKKKNVAVNTSMSRETILERGRKAGIDLGDNPDRFTKDELVDIIKGNRTLEDVASKIDKKASLKDYNVAVYPDYYVKGRKDDLINEFIKDSKNAGEPLSAKEIENLKSLDTEDAFLAIEQKVIDRANTRFGKDYETLDDYIDDIEIDNELLGLDSIYSMTSANDGIYTMTNSFTTKGRGLPRKLKKGDRKLITQHRERVIKEKIAKATASDSKKVLPKLKDKKYATVDEPLNSSKSKAKQSKGKAKKVKDLNFEGIEDGREVRIGENAKRKKGLLNRFRYEVVDRTSALGEVDKIRGDKKLQEKASGYFSSKARALYQITDGITDMQGNRVNLDLKGNVKGNSILDILDFKGEDSVLDTYLQNRFNVELATSGGNGMFTKDRWGFNEESAKKYAEVITNSYPAMASKASQIETWLKNGMRDDKTYQSLKNRFGSAIDDAAKEISKYKAELSKNIVTKLEKDFPELKNIGANWDTGWNAILKEYALKGGLINEDGLKSLYKHYFPGIRVKDAATGINSLDTPDVIKRIKGGSDTAMLTAKEQAAIMTNRVVSASYRNQVGLQILEDFEKNPNEFKAFGRIIDSDGTKVEDLDDAVFTIANTVEDILNGGKRLTVLKDGKKITLEISEELADSLKAMYYAKDTNLLSKAGKAITNPIKFGITTASATFTPANMLRDMATALIQSEHSMGKTITGWGKAIAGMTGANKKYAELYRKYIFGAGKNIDNFVQGAGFDTASILETKGLKKAKNQIVNFLTFFGEKGETIPRFGEFINTMEKTGDLERAIRDSKDVTVDFSKKGANEFVDTMNSWVMYLNAGIQGVDKFARTIKEHPLRTGGRAFTVIGVPYFLCTLLNNDNPNFWDLTDRTRQQYFCIPNFFGDKDDDGNCKTFLRLPATREYGAVLLASFDVAMRYTKGDENAGSGFLETLREGFLPNDAVTDNILAPLLINIPTNKDYKGDKILTTSEEKNLKIGKYLDKQYNANTSKAAIAVSKGANAIMGDKDIPILKYLKSPKLVDYMIDSYMGYYGNVLQSATSQSNVGVVDTIRAAALEPFENKFTADSRYSSKVLSNSFDYYDELSADKSNTELDKNGYSEAQAKYDAAKTIMDSIYDSIEVEKQIKVDTSLSRTEKNKQIEELRDARIELAKSLEEEVEKAAKEYREAPTYSSLGKDQKDKWSESLGVGKEQWAIAYNEKLKANREKLDKTGKNLTQEEKIYILQKNGITTYEQAKSIDGSIGSTFYIDDEKGQEKWETATEEIKNGRTLEDVQKDTLEKYERQKNMSDNEIKIDNKLYSKYDGNTISKDLYTKSHKEFARVDRLGDNNGSIKQDEAMNAIENLDKMYGLTQEQKSYLWYLAENDRGWKKQPYGKWNG